MQDEAKPQRYTFVCARISTTYCAKFTKKKQKKGHNIAFYTVIIHLSAYEVKFQFDNNCE